VTLRARRFENSELSVTLRDRRFENSELSVALRDRRFENTEFSESVDGSLCKQPVVDHNQPLRGVAVTGDDRGRGACAFAEELVIQRRQQTPRPNQSPTRPTVEDETRSALANKLGTKRPSSGGLYLTRHSCDDL